MRFLPSSALSFALLATLASSALVAASPVTASPPPGYSAMTFSDGFLSDDAGGHVLDASNSSLSMTSSGPSQLQLLGTENGKSAADHQFEVDVSVPSGSIAIGQYQTHEFSANPGEAQFQIQQGASGCAPEDGTLDVTEVGVDPATGQIDQFAAQYSIDCTRSVPVTGALRWNSTRTYGALSATPASWDFGAQLAHSNGTPETFTVLNTGADDVTFAARAVRTTNAQLALTSESCSGTSTTGTTLAPGSSCTATVVPHPRMSGPNGTTVDAFGAMELTASSGGGDPVALTVPMQVEGSATPSLSVTPGPDRITLAWGQQPGRISDQPLRFLIYRGTSPGRLGLLRRVQPGSDPFVDRSVRAGRTYYYAVQPSYPDRSGEVSPVVAAIAWPSYSAGMYHALRTPVRLLAARRVRAGHPLRLRPLGSNRIPSAGVASLALDVHVSSPGSATGVTLYPAGHRPAPVPDVAVGRGATASTFAITQLGARGRILVANSRGTSRVTVDVSGYFSAARGLSRRYRMGGAGHTDPYAPIILDTRRNFGKPLPAGFMATVPLNYAPLVMPHVKSLVVRVTAYGSRGRGSISAHPTGHRANRTDVLTYGRRTTTSNVTIVPAGHLRGSNGTLYPAIDLLNRGRRPVQLVVNVLGFYDDNSLSFGERYTPTAPRRLLAGSLRARRVATILPGRYAGRWNAGLLLRTTATRVRRATSVALWGDGVRRPAHPQLIVGRGTSATTTVPEQTGNRNGVDVRNAAGTVRVSVYSLGRFDRFPFATAPGYAAVPSTRYVAQVPGVGAVPTASGATATARARWSAFSGA